MYSAKTKYRCGTDKKYCGLWVSYEEALKCVNAGPTENGKLSSIYYMKNPYNGLECYIGGFTNRYMTFTGNVSNDVPVKECTEGVLAFLEQYMKRENFTKEALQAAEEEEAKNLSDMDIIHIAGNAKNAEKFNKLYY